MDDHELDDLCSSYAEELGDKQSTNAALVEALTWIVENPMAHPGNMVGVARDALAAARK